MSLALYVVTIATITLFNNSCHRSVHFADVFNDCGIIVCTKNVTCGSHVLTEENVHAHQLNDYGLTCYVHYSYVSVAANNFMNISINTLAYCFVFIATK